MKKLFVGLSVCAVVAFSAVSLSSLTFVSEAAAANGCVTIKGGKKICGKLVGDAVFKKWFEGQCYLYKNGKQGQHVDCGNVKKVLPNGNL
jgi:hypothetical protein